MKYVGEKFEIPCPRKLNLSHLQNIEKKQHILNYKLFLHFSLCIFFPFFKTYLNNN